MEMDVRWFSRPRRSDFDGGKEIEFIDDTLLII